MDKLSGRVEPSKTCLECMLIRNNNLGTSGYIFVNMCMTRDCITILVVIHFFALYGQSYKTLMTIVILNSRFESVNKMVQKMN